MAQLVHRTSHEAGNYAERSIVMKTIEFSDKEIQRLEAILIDKDKDEALKFVANLWDRVKDRESKACAPKPV